jgi:hypothetical protein
MSKSISQIKKIIKTYFCKRTYQVEENPQFQQLINWNFRFKIIKQGEKNLLLDIFDQSQPITKYCDLCSLVKYFDPNSKFGIVLPQGTTLLAEDICKLNNSDIDIYTIDKDTLQLISSPIIRDEIKRHKIESLKNNLRNVNTICSGRFGFKLFKKDQKHIDILTDECKTKKDFVILAAAIASLIDEIFYDEIKKIMLPKLTQTEKKKFKEGSINIIELILLKNKIFFSTHLITNLRDIKKIRNNLPPIHSGNTVVIGILHNWGIKCSSINKLNWKEIGEIYLEKYISSILLLRDTIKV